MVCFTFLRARPKKKHGHGVVESSPSSTSPSPSSSPDNSEPRLSEFGFRRSIMGFGLLYFPFVHDPRRNTDMGWVWVLVESSSSPSSSSPDNSEPRLSEFGFRRNQPQGPRSRSRSRDGWMLLQRKEGRKEERKDSELHTAQTNCRTRKISTSHLASLPITELTVSSLSLSLSSVGGGWVDLRTLDWSSALSPQSSR